MKGDGKRVSNKNFGKLAARRHRFNLPDDRGGVRL